MVRSISLLFGPSAGRCANTIFNSNSSSNTFSTDLLRRLMSSSTITDRQQPLEFSRLKIKRARLSDLKEKPPVSDLVFGKVFTDHMLTIDWDTEQGWHAPQIGPFQNFSMHPGAKVLHYAQELFEGMKAYRGVDGKIRMFRPMHNMARMNVTAARCCLPTFDGAELLRCIRELVLLDSAWVPHDTSSSLYIRPTLIGTEPTIGLGPANETRLFVLLSPVGPYYSAGFNPVNLLCDPAYVRAWPGGCGYAKMGSNYAPTLWIQKVAAEKGCQQVLWLLGEDQQITEVGAMNLFILLRDPAGQLELVAPCLSSGCILPGVTRRSVVELVSGWQDVRVTERTICMDEVMAALSEGRLVEMFGSGTAAVVSPVGGLHYQGSLHTIPTPEDGLATRIMAAMTDIYYGRTASPWSVEVETWDLEQTQALEDYFQPEAVRTTAAV